MRSLPGLGVVEADLVVAVEFCRVAMGGVGFREIGHNRNSVRTNQPEVDAEVVGLAAVDHLEQIQCKEKASVVITQKIYFCQFDAEAAEQHLDLAFMQDIKCRHAVVHVCQQTSWSEPHCELSFVCCHQGQP